MNKPFFSVIIPTFNQLNFLKKALDSVFKQTYRNFEIIVIDNYSKDGTENFVKKNNKKIIYKKIHNKGIIAKSRNLGIKLAKGKWVTFLDSDDYWKKNKLDTVYNLQKNSFLEIICHSEWAFYSDKKFFKFQSYGPYKNNFYELLLKQGNRLSTSATTVKKDFIYKNKIIFDEKKEFISSEDYSFFMNIARNKANFYFVNQPLGYHVFHKQSISSNLSKHLKSAESVLKHHTFNVQKFTKNKVKLWEEIKNFYTLKIIFINLSNSSLNKQLKKLIRFFFRKPIFTIIFIQNILLKKFKDYLLHLFYKSEL